MLLRPLHEQCDVRVVEKVIAKVFPCQFFVRNIRAFVYMRIHAERGGVDYYFVFCHDLGCQFAIGQRVVTFGARHPCHLDSQILQSAAYGLCRATGAEH